MKINRKKEVKSKNRNKWIIGGIVAFASVGLIGNGFATWVIGSTSTEKDQGITITVDDAQEMNVQLSATLNDDSIELKEVNTTDPTLVVRVTDGLAVENLSFAFSTFTISYPQKMGFRVTMDLVDTSRITTSSSLLGEGVRTGTSWTYVDFEAFSLDITADMMITDSSSGGTSYYYDLYTQANAASKFTWGTFFGNKSPSTYYNALFNDGMLTVNDENKKNVKAELDAMAKAYEGGTLTFKITVTPLTA